MDYDLSLFCSISKVKSDFPDTLFVQRVDGNLKISKSVENSTKELEQIIVSFLDVIEKYDKDIFEHKSILLIGAYHEIEKSVTFTVRLSHLVLSILVEKKVSIEVTGYPCREN